MTTDPNKSQITSGQSMTFSWAVPTDLDVSPDPLRLRIDFHHQATTITFFDGEKVETKLVDAMDIAYALASELTFSTGLLPEGCLWWNNTKYGQKFAIYTEPQIRKLALQVSVNEPPVRFTIPTPGLVFLCSPAKPPAVYAVGKKPTKETSVIYKAPFPNLNGAGQSCAGSHKYPERVADIIPSFFTSFFSAESQLGGRSKKYPQNIIELWKDLDGKVGTYPVSDLVKYCTLGDLMKIS